MLSLETASISAPYLMQNQGNVQRIALSVHLETARSFYSQICSTHPYEERVETVKAAREAGLSVCSGGFLALEEDLSDAGRSWHAPQARARPELDSYT